MKQKEIALLNAEMAKHANGAALFLNALLDDRSATQEQKADMADYLLDRAKKNIEDLPYATRERKDAEIRRREEFIKLLKLGMCL